MTRPKPLKCPWCGSEQSAVIESRVEPKLIREQLSYSGEGFWRKRRCQRCRGTFGSEEFVTVALDPPADRTTTHTALTTSSQTPI